VSRDPASSVARVVRAAYVLTPLELIPNGAVLVSGPRITAVGPWEALRSAGNGPVLDCGENTIVPGFVDVHIHGCGGASVMAGSAAIGEVSRFVTQYGVTSWLPTLTPRRTIPELCEVIRSALAGLGPFHDGAEAAGFHLEGPFLSPKRPGAIPAENFRPPAVGDVQEMLAAGQGHVRLMTLAPELTGGLDVVRALVAGGATASIGHSDATAEEALAAIEAGVSHATHMFNAMRPLHHRDPGVVGAVLVAPHVRGELIADGVHVDPLAMRALIQAKGVSRIALITDAVAPAGLGDGGYEIDGRPITVSHGKATLADGTIVGSVATFDGNFRRIVRECGLSLAAASTMASLVPARSVGLSERKGYLGGGRDADLVVLDSDLRVRLTMARGRVVFDCL
jgi:N-acetylglucosamine-6-phosphate deacetylase